MASGLQEESSHALKAWKEFDFKTVQPYSWSSNGPRVITSAGVYRTFHLAGQTNVFWEVSSVQPYYGARGAWDTLRNCICSGFHPFTHHNACHIKYTFANAFSSTHRHGRTLFCPVSYPLSWEVLGDFLRVGREELSWPWICLQVLLPAREVGVWCKYWLNSPQVWKKISDMQLNTSPPPVVICCV